jgi:hypothetical protein
MRIKEYIHDKLRYVGAIAAVSTIGSMIAANGYMWHRQSDMVDNYVELKKEVRDMEIELLTAIRDKQEACKVLEATVTSQRYTHTYCRIAE